MTFLHCLADFDRVYYVVYHGAIHQCKFLRTSGDENGQHYILNIAGEGVVSIRMDRPSYDQWNRSYYGNTIDSILSESVEGIERGHYVQAEYGTTTNAYCSKILKGLFKHISVCNCGGDIYTWKWDGIRPVRYRVEYKEYSWVWDEDGFHSNIEDGQEDCYKTEEECRQANSPKVVTF